MTKFPFTSPVIDSVPKVNKEVAVGEDVEFQRKWWAFERTVWVFFSAILLLTILGVFGRGVVARKEIHSPDGGLTVKFDRIARTGTPSDMTVTFGSGAIQDGKVELWVNETLISKLGAQRISPQPEASIIGNGGVTYVFPVLQAPATVIFSLQPPGPGSFPYTLRVPNTPLSVGSTIVVVP